MKRVMRRHVRCLGTLLLTTFGARALAVDAHFHHVHLNSQDPQKAIDFYTAKFEARRARFAGLQDAVWTGDSWLLFTKVNAPPPTSLISPIWHFGWGAPDMKAEYARQQAMNTQFFAPITPLSDTFFFAYVESPEHALIELNTAASNKFGHVHLFSADPVTAGEWYMKHFGLTRRGNAAPSREPRFRGDLQIGPSMSLMSDHVNLIIYPVEYSKKQYANDWPQGQTTLVSPRGRIVDHIGHDQLPGCVTAKLDFEIDKRHILLCPCLLDDPKDAPGALGHLRHLAGYGDPKADDLL